MSTKIFHRFFDGKGRDPLKIVALMASMIPQGKLNHLRIIIVVFDSEINFRIFAFMTY